MKEIKPEDIKISKYQVPSQGFHPSKVGIAITHLPTGIIASSCEGRGEHHNRQTAMEILRTELAKLEGVNCVKIPALKTGNLPEGSYLPFKAMAQGHIDYSVDVMYVNTADYGKLMCICATEGAIYITREQAKKFFGFKD